MSIDLTISPDHIPAIHAVVTTSLGLMAVWSYNTGYAAYPKRYNAALLAADGRVRAQYSGSESAWGAVAQLLISNRPYRSDIDADLALMGALTAQAKSLCAEVR